MSTKVLKKANKGKLVKLIKRNTELSDSFKVVFIPFFKKYSSVELHSLSMRLHESYVFSHKEGSEQTKYFLSELTFNLFHLAATDNNWKGIDHQKIDNIFHGLSFNFPLMVLSNLEKLDTHLNIEWYESELNIIADLKAALTKYHFLLVERELCAEEKAYLGLKVE